MLDEVQPLEPARCAEMIRGAKSVVALTGAGISTAAGIPDFRGPQGLYVTRRYDPERVFEISAFRCEPQYFYEFSRDFVTAVENILPTFSHRLLAKLEKKGFLAGVVTQNIDMLHQLAGSRTVVDLHGSYRSATCMACGKKFKELSYDWWDKAMATSPSSPIAVCSTCSGVLKPDIVFFGESVNAYSEAEQLIAQCDLLLVLGSSLNVSPASFLPCGTQATTVIVNRGGVVLPAAPHRFFVDSDLDTYFQKVNNHLGMDGD